MSAFAGGSSLAGNPLTWSLLFARQPEPDLEFTEEELEQTTNVRPSAPMKTPKKSGGRPFLWIVLLLLIGGGAYVAMEPEMVMDLVGPLLGESPPPPQQPPVAMKPATPKPAPGPPMNQPGPAATSPAPPSGQSSQPSAPAQGTGPQAGAPSPMPAPPSAQPAPATAPPIVASPLPLFGEGQQVTLLPSPAAPGDKVSLMQDADGTAPGAAIPPGTVLTILDGEFQNGTWVYAVRSNYGTKGWIAEKQLRAKP
jgi:hypothetical protein